jgi:hypothetical protein
MPKFVHDQRTGAGYGFTGRKGFQNPEKSGDKFPYNTENSDEEEAYDDSDSGLNLRALINKKVSYGNLAKRPEPFSRTDRFTMAKNRLDLAENSATPRTTLSGIVPFPMRKFDGPALGGTSSNPSFTVAPGVVDVDPRGWSMGDVKANPVTDQAPFRFVDAVNPDLRERTRKKLKIARLSQE